MYTKCPQCQTTFGVTVDQLEARDGAVRCGRCMEVFNARWNLVDAMVQAEPALDIPEPVETTSKVETARPAADSAVVENSHATPASEPPSISLPGESDSAASDARPTTASRASPLDGFDLVEPSEAKPRAEVAASVETSSDEPAPPTKPISEDPPSTLLDKPAPVSLPKATPAEIMQNDDLAKAFGRGNIVRGKRTAALELPETQTRSGRPHREPPIPPDFLVNAEPAESDAPAPVEKTVAEAPPKPPVKERAEKNKVQTPPAVAGDVSADAAPKFDRDQFDGLGRPEVDQVAAKRIPVAVWFAGSALMLGLLVAQARFFYLDDLAQSPSTRPVAQTLCRLTGCAVPDQKLTEQFRVVATDIRFHPDAPAAVRIRTRILNTAAIDQPFPDIQLTLTDKSGKVVGRRTFKPVHYLGRRFNPRDRISPEMVKQIDLDLMSPHADAIGFEVELVHRITSSDNRRG